MNMTQEQFQQFREQYNQLQERATQILRIACRQMLQAPDNPTEVVDQVVDCLHAQITSINNSSVSVVPEFQQNGQPMDGRLTLVYSSILPSSLSVDLLLSDNWEELLPERIANFQQSVKDRNQEFLESLA